MKSKTKMIIIIGAIILALAALAVCIVLLLQGGKKPAKRKVIKKIVVIQEDPGTNNNDNNDFTPLPILPEDDYYVEDDEDFIVDDTYERVRRLVSFKTTTDDDIPKYEYVPEHKVTKSAWAGPEGYVIVASKDVRASRDSAKRLQAYFKEALGITVPCVTDETPATAKEILVGDTNRRTSSLADTKFAVTLEGEKLVFEGGHYAMTDTAVDWFVSYDYEAGKVNLLTGEIKDFLPSVTIDNVTYDYVWGDEHGGNKINRLKWHVDNAFDASGDQAHVGEGDLVRVNEGQLKMTADNYYNMYQTDKPYVTNAQINTRNTMSYIFGYAEFRAKVPYKQGSWPAYWYLSQDALNTRYYNSDCNLFIEIDFLEAMSTNGKNVPNLHKWYKSTSQRTIQTGNHHTAWQTCDVPSIVPYTFYEPAKASEEYHNYGMLWNEDVMKFYLDNEWYWEFDLTYNFDGVDYDGDADTHWTDNPIYIILSNQLITPKGGYQNENNKIDASQFPFEFFIDWSRYYQIEGKGELNLAPENY